MKKNWTMKLAGLLLALTMITACFVGSTFAKYVTRAQGEAEARVAKWGVLLTVEGDPFGTQYATHDDTYEGEFSVVSSNEDYVVAPGTSAADLDKALKATVSGTPEVAARYTLEGDVTDVVLPAGTYTDYTNLVKANDGTYGYTGEFTLDADYTPIIWNLVIRKGSTEFNVATELYNALAAYPNLLQQAEALGFSREGCSFFSAVQILDKVANGNGGDGYQDIIDAALSNVVSGGSNFQLEVDDNGHFMLSYDFEPNKNMDFEFELTWQWLFEQEDVELYDKADTFLGNIAAGVVELPEGASITISANLTATATQID